MEEEVAIVTGANKGIGFEIVKGLCENVNGSVYLTARDEKRGTEACNQLINLNLKINPKFHQLDVTDMNSIEIFKNHLTEKHFKIDILINNAGVMIPNNPAVPLIQQVEETMKVNFYSLVIFTEAMLPFLKNGAKIINVSSSSGHLSRIPSKNLRSQLKDTSLTVDGLLKLMNSYVDDVRESKHVAEWGDSPYVVSKVAVSAYTFILHRKLFDKGIHVNCVHPGHVITDMTQGAGSLTPQQGALAPLHLALQSNIKGAFMWHNKTVVDWDGPDPRVFIDGKKL